MLKTLSHSKLEQIRACPLSAYFDHILKTPPETQFSDISLIGKSTHTTISTSIKEIKTLHLNTLNPVLTPTILDDLNRSIQEGMLGVLQANNADDETCDIVANCLTNFMQLMERRYSYCEQKNLSPIQFLPSIVEERYTTTLNDITFRGDIDAIFKDSKLWPIDWKTNSNTTITPAMIRQATCYALLYNSNIGIDQTPITEFFMVNLRKKVNLNKCLIKITPSMIEEQKQEILQSWETFNGNYFPKNKSYTSCLFCNHKLLCLSYDDEGHPIQ